MNIIEQRDLWRFKLTITKDCYVIAVALKFNTLHAQMATSYNFIGPNELRRDTENLE